MNDGQDTGGGFGSFGTSNQGFSGNLNLQGGGYNSGIQGFTQQQIVSGTDDIILVPSNEKKPKKWLIILGVLLLIGVCAGIGGFVLLQNSGLMGNQMSNEEREKAVDILIEQSGLMRKIVDMVEKGLEGKTFAKDFFSDYTVEKIKKYEDGLESFGVIEAELKKINYTGEVKDKVNEAILSLENYAQIASSVLAKLDNFMDAFLESDYDELEAFAAENNFDQSKKELLLDYAHKYFDIEPVLRDCTEGNNCNMDLIIEYEDGIEEGEYLIKDIFSSVINDEQLGLLREYIKSVNETRSFIELWGQEESGSAAEE